MSYQNFDIDVSLEEIASLQACNELALDARKQKIDALVELALIKDQPRLRRWANDLLLSLIHI